MPYCGRCLNVGTVLSRRQACARREVQYELIIGNGFIDGQLRYLKLDGVFLQWSPDLDIRWEKQPIEFPIFIVANIGNDRPVFVIKKLLVRPQISSVEHNFAR